MLKPNTSIQQEGCQRQDAFVIQIESNIQWSGGMIIWIFYFKQDCMKSLGKLKKPNFYSSSQESRFWCITCSVRCSASPVEASLGFLANHVHLIIYHFKFCPKWNTFFKICFLYQTNGCDLQNVVQWWGFSLVCLRKHIFSSLGSSSTF